MFSYACQFIFGAVTADGTDFYRGHANDNDSCVLHHLMLALAA